MDRTIRLSGCICACVFTAITKRSDTMTVVRPSGFAIDCDSNWRQCATDELNGSVAHSHTTSHIAAYRRRRSCWLPAFHCAAPSLSLLATAASHRISFIQLSRRLFLHKNPYVFNLEYHQSNHHELLVSEISNTIPFGE